MCVWLNNKNPFLAQGLKTRHVVESSDRQAGVCVCLASASLDISFPGSLQCKLRGHLQ